MKYRKSIIPWLQKLFFLFAFVAIWKTNAELADMSTGGPYDPEEEYRLSITGIIGTVADDHILVTRVKRGSPVDNVVQSGDRIIRIQGVSLSRDLSASIRRHMLRLWRENNGRLALTLVRPGEDKQEDLVFGVQLHLPAPSGTIQHFGPMGIFAALQEDHIEITEVAKGSPADGVLRAGDRIHKIGGRPLRGDFYKLFTESIDQAETEAANGELSLGVFRTREGDADEQSIDLTLVLPVTGTRTESSPFACPKTDALIDRAAEYLLASGDMGRLNIGLLGLLSTGEERFIAYVGKRLREADFTRPDLDISMSASMTSWPWSYQLITLCEYYLLTGDTYVLPAIRTAALTFARGQDIAGLWNHRMADPEANRGQLHGRLYGYGAINQTSAPIWIGLILAEKCGIDEPEIRRAIEKTRALYANWAGKGGLPYGNHAAMEHILTNNGTSGSVAVGFALLGDKEAAAFYGKLSAASHGDIFTGHTGPFFNYLWSGLGANVLGPEVWAAYENQIRWLRTLTRVWDGSFQYMEQRGDIFSYSELSSTGANLLNMAAGRRALHITGKGMDENLWLRGDAVQSAIYRPEPNEEMALSALLELVGHVLPPVRLEAARTLAGHAADVEEGIRDMLYEGTREQRIGALHTLRHIEIAHVADSLMSIIMDDSEDLWIRELAIGTVAQIDSADSLAGALLRLIVLDKPYDRFGNLDLALGRALVNMLSPDPYAHDLDWDVFYAAVLKLLDHPHMWARGAGMRLLENIPLDEFYRVADRVLHVIRDEDLSYTAYHADGPRQAGLALLNRLQIEEVLALAIRTIDAPTGQQGVRRRNRISLIRSFGREAELVIPLLEEVLGDAAVPLAESIRGSEMRREMIPLAEVTQGGDAP